MQIFKNFLGEHAPGPPSVVFGTCLKLPLPKKTTLENVTKIGVPYLKKILNTPLT